MSEKDGASQMSEPVAWRIKIGDSDLWSYVETEWQADFYGKQRELPYVKEPLYASSLDYAMGVADAARCRDAVEILPYDMPNEMWQRIRKDKEVAMEAFRIAVCQTLDEYEAAIRALSAPSVTEEWVREQAKKLVGDTHYGEISYPTGQDFVRATLAALGIEVTK